MGKKKKESIRIINKDHNREDYTFVSDSILNNINNIGNNNESEPYIKIENKSDERTEKKKIFSKKVDNKGRKILGKSMQGHSPVYE
jgi:hypothetical protein